MSPLKKSEFSPSESTAENRPQSLGPMSNIIARRDSFERLWDCTSNGESSPTSSAIIV